MVWPVKSRNEQKGAVSLSVETMMKHDERQKNCNGFTLIEVLIALAIFSIGILGVAKMQISAINGNAGARKYNEAAAFAQGQMETLMSLDFTDDINNDNASSDLADNGYTVFQDGGYTIKWKVTGTTDLAPADGVIDLKQINVVVDDPRGEERANINFIKAADV